MNYQSNRTEFRVSYQESLHAAHKTRQARFARAALNVQVAAKIEQERPVERKRAKPRIEVQHDAHVIDWQAKKEAYDAIEVEGRKIRCSDYIKQRAADFGFTYADVIGPSRVRHITDARQVIVFEIKMKVKPTISFPELGRIVGGRDHTTILHSCGKFGYPAECDGNAAYHATLARLMNIDRVKAKKRDHAAEHARRKALRKARAAG